MNFMKKIFDRKEDDSVHLQFQKFGKGEFRDRALIHVKKMGKNYSVKTSAEFANELVKFIAEKLGDNKTKVKGLIVSTLDLTGEIEYVKKSQFQGVKKYFIDTGMSGNEIISLIDNMPKNFFALIFEIEGYKLKIKQKAPKSGKPGKGGEEAKADFCVLKTNDLNLVKSFVFEKEDFTEAKINHTFFIEEIVPPKGETDFSKIRELAKRKGKIHRKAEIDGEVIEKDIEFEA